MQRCGEGVASPGTGFRIEGRDGQDVQVFMVMSVLKDGSGAAAMWRGVVKGGGVGCKRRLVQRRGQGTR